MSVEDGRRPTRPEPWDMAREPKNNLERLIASAPAAPCTCPGGDGSLRWPCPAHPNADYSRLTLSPGARTLRTAPVTEQAVAEPVAVELPHYDDIAIDHFACAMKIKMAASRAKGRGGWDDPKQCSNESLQTMLIDHLAKGDPVDVANFCMMLWIRSGQTVAAVPPSAPQDQHFAWAAFAENGNVIIWSRCRSEVEPVAAKHGRPIVPVIALGALSAPVSELKGNVPMLTVKEAFEAVGGWYNGGEAGYPSFGSTEALWRYTQKMQQNAVQRALTAGTAPAVAKGGDSGKVGVGNTVNSHENS